MGIVLKTYCIPRFVVKTLAHCFPPKLSQFHLARGVLTGPYEQCCHHGGFNSGICLGSPVPRLHVSARTEPATLLSGVATCLGRLFPALHSRYVSVVFHCIFCQ